MIVAGLLYPIIISIVACVSKKSNGESSDNWKYNDWSNRNIKRKGIKTEIKMKMFGQIKFLIEK